MNSAKFEFIGELNDFLKNEKKGITFDFSFEGSPSAKDIIESLGVPHVEIDAILINNVSVPFNYNLKNGDYVKVHSIFEPYELPDIIHLKEKITGIPSFIADVQIGKLARYLRLLGFDALCSDFYR